MKKGALEQATVRSLKKEKYRLRKVGPRKPAKHRGSGLEALGRDL